MASLSERFGKLKSKQVNRAIESKAIEPPPEDLMKKFEKLLPVMTSFWGYSPEEVDHIKSEWTKPDVLPNAIKGWLEECERYSLEVPDDNKFIRSRKNSAKALYLKKTIGNLVHNEEDGPWIAMVIEVVPENERPEVLDRYAQIYLDPAVPKESERRRMANLSLIEAAEKINPELYKTIEQSSRKLV